MIKFAFQVVSSFILTVAMMVALIMLEGDLTVIEGGFIVVMMIAGAGYFVCTLLAMIEEIKQEQAKAAMPSHFSVRECRMVSKK